MTNHFKYEKATPSTISLMHSALLSANVGHGPGSLVAQALKALASECRLQTAAEAEKALADYCACTAARPSEYRNAGFDANTAERIRELTQAIRDARAREAKP